MNGPSQNPFADQPPQQFNPYAAPTMPQPMQHVPNYQGGVWRKGNVLVMHQRAQLPQICVKSGMPATTWLKRDMSWFHPACYLALLGGLIPLLIVALIVTKKATVHVGLSEEWAARRKRWLTIGWCTAGLGLAMLIGGIVLAANDIEMGIIGVPLGIVVMLGGGIAGSIGSRIVTPKKITDEYVWMKGVHPDVLNMFPEWTQQ
jgi:hypothetical protein